MIGGPDLKKLEEYSTKILERMKTIPDAVDVDSTLISGKPEVQLEVDRDTAADLGVRIGDVSQALNTLVAGQDATTFNQGSEQYDVTVRAINPFRTSVEGLNRMIVPSANVKPISPLLDQAERSMSMAIWLCNSTHSETVSLMGG